MRRIYIYQQKDWPAFTWNADVLMPALGHIRHLQGHLLGRMKGLGFGLGKEAELETLTADVVKSSEIEGEHLDVSQVRSSIARRLGLDVGGLIPVDRDVEGVVEMMLDATQNYPQRLTKERLFNWHAALFPTGRSGMYKISVGQWRNNKREPMQIVSGAMGKEKVHFEAPPANILTKEMNAFLKWFNGKTKTDPVLKAGMAHLWFVTIHPFEDGNGRIARAIADMQLARADNSSQRFYSMSAQIRKLRKEYYTILERTQKGGLDITPWLQWFLDCLMKALEHSEHLLQKILSKADFWQKQAKTPLNERQRIMLNRLMDDFKGKLTSSKWAKITKCSQDTALRDIQDLIKKGILEKEAAGGRSTGYKLVI